ncbi:myb-like protein Q, partial [Vespula squamosa]
DVVTTDDPAKGSYSSNCAIVLQGVPLRDHRQKVNLKHKERTFSHFVSFHSLSFIFLLPLSLFSSLVPFLFSLISSFPRLTSFFRERAQNRDGVEDTTRRRNSETLDVSLASAVSRIRPDKFGKGKMTMPYAANRQTSQEPMCFTLIWTFMIRLENHNMSEMTSVEKQQEHQQQQQQYVGGSSNSEYHCKDCDLYFESDKSLRVHLCYHQENLSTRWNQTQQEESNNNNSKAGNHNSGGGGHSNAKRESVTATVDSCESSSTSPSQEPSSSRHQHQEQQQQQQQQPQQQSQQQQPPPPPQQQQQQPQSQQQQQQQHQEQQQQQQQQQQQTSQSYNHFHTPMYSETSYFIQNDSAYLLSHHYSSSQDDVSNNVGVTGGGGYSRYHPYQHQQHFPTERTCSISSTSPQSPPLQCDKCGAVYEDANQLGEHVRTSHSNSPNVYPGQPQYQQLGGSPQQQNQPQLHPSPTQPSQQPQQQQQHGYEYNGGQAMKSSEVKQEPEEQAEILDLDSHKVQTHRYEEELMRLHHHQQHQQDLQMQIHQQQVLQHQQQRSGSLPVGPMLGWPPGGQPHEYHPGLPSMGGMENVSPISDQGQFIRGQHMSVVESSRHPGSPIITSTQTIPTHQLPATLLQQPPKAPPLANQSWKSNEARRPKTYNCTACNKWFTSSGHLKRHYNTTLHKNAVKQSNQPDPANLPISAHHHPGRDNGVGHGHGHGSVRGTGPSRSSPELSSSASPPNLIAGPSGEAARGLLHTPTTTTTTTTNTLYNNNNNSSNSSNSSNESSVVVLAQQQQQQQPQGSMVLLGSTMLPLNSPGQSPMAAHHQQMGSSPPQLVQHHHRHQHQQQQQQHHQQQQQQQQQQQLHIPMDSPSGQIHIHHPMNSPISVMQQHPGPHLSSPSQMGSSHPHHLTSPTTSGSVHPAMVSPPAMGNTTTPQQVYPNALPPHVTTSTNMGLLESITIQLTTTGNSLLPISSVEQQQQQQQQQQLQHQHHHLHQQTQDMLPGFGTFSNHQRSLPSFTQFGISGFLVGHDQVQAVNVGGLSPEENRSPQDGSFESPGSSYDPYKNSSPRYESLTNISTMQVNTDGMIVKQYEIENQQHHLANRNNNDSKSTKLTTIYRNICRLRKNSIRTLAYNLKKIQNRKLPACS